MEISLPGHDQDASILAKHSEKLDFRGVQMTTDCLSNNLFDDQNPVVHALTQPV